MDTAVFGLLDAWNNSTNQILSIGLGLAPFTATYDGSIPVGATFNYTDGNDALFSGTYDGTNSNGDLIFNNGGSFEVLTNFNYAIGDTLTVTAQPFVCFLRGTLIRTPKGDVAVETLQIGDLVLTSPGERRPVKWIGHRDIDLRQLGYPRHGRPVRIAAGAFGPDRPSKDLYVSPGHAICIDLCGELLIPAEKLVNGATIAEVECDQASYWHVELDSHDILLANNLPAESYLAVGNRSFFEEAGKTLDAEEQDRGPSRADYCRPIVLDGPVPAFVRRRLIERAEALGWTASRETDLHLLVDGAVRRPLEEGNAAAFLFPANAQDVRLVSNTFVPARLGHNDDSRELGLCVHGLSFSGAQGAPRSITPDDERFAGAFHREEAISHLAWRWTKGELILKPELWSGLSGVVALLVAHDSDATRGWVAPAAGKVERSSRVGRPKLRAVG